MYIPSLPCKTTPSRNTKSGWHGHSSHSQRCHPLKTCILIDLNRQGCLRRTEWRMESWEEWRVPNKFIFAVAKCVYRGKSVILLSSQRFYKAVSTVTYTMFSVFRRTLAGRDAADQASCCGCKWLHLIAWLRPLASVCELYNLQKCSLCFTNLKCSFNFLMDVCLPKTLSTNN